MMCYFFKKSTSNSMVKYRKRFIKNRCAHEQTLASLTTGEMQVKNHKIPSHTYSDGYDQKKIITSVGKDTEKSEPSWSGVGSVK